MAKKLFYVAAIIITMISCTKKVDEVSITHDAQHEVLIQRLSSPEELRQMIESNDGNVVATKSSYDTFKSLLTEINSEELNLDPILSVESQLLNVTIPEQGLFSIYELLGYDWLVPNKTFASLLNVRGEVEVADTIYKVSPRGTFFFHKDLLKTFEDNYADILNAQYLKLDTSTYISEVPEAEGIKLFDTFNTGGGLVDLELEPYDNAQDTKSVQTKSIYINDNWVDALNINWDSFPAHYTDARTWAGELIEGVFGRNVSFETEFDSKHRLKAKLYYYDYVAYSEIGAKSKMQKKNWIGWSKTTASKMYQIWSHIVIWTPYQNTVSYPHTGNSTTIPRYYLGTVTEDIPGVGKAGLVAYYAGRDLSDAELKSFANSNYVQNALNLLIENLPNQLPNTIMAAKYLTEKGVYTIVYPYGKALDNAEVIQSKFSKDFHIHIGISLTPGALPNNFAGWVKSASAQGLKTPKLKSGEMRTAATYNGQTKGMRIIKQYEDE